MTFAVYGSKFTFHFDSIKTSLSTKQHSIKIAFTFHFDSIKTQCEFRDYQGGTLFTFHFDSIKTKCLRVYM